MSTFNDILIGEEEDLVKIFYTFKKKDDPEGNNINLASAAKKLKLQPEKLTIALGFNRNAKGLGDIFSVLGYDSFESLTKERNEIYINDIYEKISLENILMLYSIVRDDNEMLQVMQYLLRNRLENIESRIEATVNSLIIEKYKAEMQAVYADRIADIDFAEERLNNVESGFRALLNEACIITESRLIPAGDIFFRESILPEEKRKLLSKNLIPVTLVESRLQDNDISQQEKQMLNDFLKMNHKNNTGGTTNQ
ncbi:MAG: hypothetical protein ACI9ZT_000718 [Gammaproteobacteria bacterium]|jgi:hypothetical protein